MKKTLKILGLMVFSLIFVIGCSNQKQQAEITIPLDGADIVQTKIKMAAGELNISGGADVLASTIFTYSEESEKPLIDYTKNGSESILEVQQPDILSFGINDNNKWLIKLNNTIKMDLNISLGAGKGDLKLGNLSLNHLDIDSGDSNLEIDLRGSGQQDLNARIRAGIGKITLYLPENVGVRIYVDQAIGQINTKGLQKNDNAYVNDNYGVSDVAMELTIEAGLGNINLFVEN